MPKHLYDPKCYEVAEHFLPDEASEGLKDELSAHIQDAIEMWLQAEEGRLLHPNGAEVKLNG